MSENIRVIDIQYDEKLKSFSVMTLMSIEKYLELSTDTEESLEIQRKIISTKKSKIYSRLVQDLKVGCIIPPIVLVVREMPENIIADINNLNINESEINKTETILRKLSDYIQSLNANQISILDGLQRTNCLRKAKTELEGETDKLNRFIKRDLRVEFWLNIKFQAILYRMITLNAGQTPMSMKHQLEILNINLKDSICNVRDDIEIFTTGDVSRRTKAKQYQFSILVEGYNAFINKSAFTDVKNQVIEELNRIDFLESFENSKAELGLEDFVNTIADIDEGISSKYSQIENNESLKYGYQILSKQTFFIGLCAALGRAYDFLDYTQFQQKKNELHELLNSDIDDPLNLQTLFSIIDSIPSKTKIGDIERELVTEGFNYFFISKVDFGKSWKYAGNRVI